MLSLRIRLPFRFGKSQNNPYTAVIPSMLAELPLVSRCVHLYHESFIQDTQHLRVCSSHMYKRWQLNNFQTHNPHRVQHQSFMSKMILYLSKSKSSYSNINKTRAHAISLYFFCHICANHKGKSRPPLQAVLNRRTIHSDSFYIQNTSLSFFPIFISVIFVLCRCMRYFCLYFFGICSRPFGLPYFDIGLAAFCFLSN